MSRNTWDADPTAGGCFTRFVWGADSHVSGNFQHMFCEWFFHVRIQLAFNPCVTCICIHTYIHIHIYIHTLHVHKSINKNICLYRNSISKYISHIYIYIHIYIIYSPYPRSHWDAPGSSVATPCAADGRPAAAAGHRQRQHPWLHRAGRAGWCAVEMASFSSSRNQYVDWCMVYELPFLFIRDQIPQTPLNQYVTWCMVYELPFLFIRDQIPQTPLNKYVTWCMVYELPFLFIRDQIPQTPLNQYVKWLFNFRFSS